MDCVKEMGKNPRKIKRVINIYRLARLLTLSNIPPQKLIRWILLTEQWPLHMAWVIKIIEKEKR